MTLWPSRDWQLRRCRINVAAELRQPDVSGGNGAGSTRPDQSVAGFQVAVSTSSITVQTTWEGLSWFAWPHQWPPRIASTGSVRGNAIAGSRDTRIKASG